MKKLFTLLTVLLLAGMAVGKTQKIQKTHHFKNRKLVLEKSDVGVPFSIGPDTFIIREAYLNEDAQRLDWVVGKQRYSFWHNGNALQFMTDQKWIWSVACDNAKRVNKLSITTEENSKDTIIRKLYCYVRSNKKFVWDKRPPIIQKIPPKTKTLIASKQSKKQLTAKATVH